MVGTDLCEINKKDYLVILDAYPSYPEVIPYNGPCYSSEEFADLKNKWEFKHITSSPHFLSSNGLVEKAAQTVKNIITKSIESRTDPFFRLFSHHKTSPTTKLLPPPKKGETVRIYNQNKSIWGEKATAKEQVQYRRNRKHLRKVALEVEDREEKQSTSKRAEKQVKMKSLSAGRSIYGRTIKKPQNLKDMNSRPSR